MAYSDTELRALNIAPRSVSDAAISDSPNYRGCHWASDDEFWSYSQIVGNETSLSAYKTKQDLRTWQTDRVINGRSVGIADDPPGGCIAVFMSQRAVVITAARSTTKLASEPDLKTHCDKAVAFATLATTKAP